MKGLINFFKVIALMRKIGFKGILDLSKDQLTGLENRGRYEDVVKKEMARSYRYKESLSIVVIDIDGLKAINDTIGHLGGDKIIRRTANAITEAIRESDHAFRWGGDEFVIILPRSDLFEARKFLERIDLKLRAQKISFSWGGAEYRNQNPDEFFKESEDAMYRLKKMKKARY